MVFKGSYALLMKMKDESTNQHGIFIYLISPIDM